MDKPKSAVTIISEFFFQGMKASEKMAELKKLTDTDKQQLVDGISNGTLTY